MKLQHLAIIFVIIILPISLILGEYIHSQINTINLQTSYSSKLQTATYDAMQSLKLNTINSKYSTVSDSKLRDIEASISTFYKSLGQEIKLNTYTREDLTEYTPAILYTMYDGYYIYSKYYNESSNQYEYGLKPFIYYTCRYKKGSIDIIVNYTLDNYITIYGYVGENYITKSGNVIDPNKVTDITYSSGNLKSLKYGGITIEKEHLSEQIVYLNTNNQAVKDGKQYDYIIYNNNKVYYESANKFFTINSNNKKQYIVDQTIIADLNKHVEGGIFYSDSALKYYDEAYKFSKWIEQYLPGIKQEHAVDGNGKKITAEEFGIDTGTSSIFNCSEFNQYGDSEITDSTFDLNRMAVIRKSIKDNLLTAIANYNNLSSNTSYEYVLPVLNENDWYKITNNISMVSFMQGIPIGTKYYNNYCVITNNENKEVVKLSTLYAITEDGEVHLLNCKDILDGKKKVVKVYKNIDFERQTVVKSENEEVYYYPHANSRCYSCLVNAAEIYDIDYIEGTVKEYDYKTEAYILKTGLDSTTLITLRKEVLTALARERYDLYKINDYFKGFDETIGVDSIPGKDDGDFNGNIELIECKWNESTHKATAKFGKKDEVSDTLKLQYQINATDKTLSDNTAWKTDGTYNNGNSISLGEYPVGTKIYLRLFDGTYDGDYLVYTIKDLIEPSKPTILVVQGTEGENNYYTSDIIKVQISAGVDNQSGVKKLTYKLSGANTTDGEIEISSGTIIDIPNDGDTYVEAWTYDNALPDPNYSYNMLPLKKDSVPPDPPSIFITSGYYSGSSGYYTSSVTVRLGQAMSFTKVNYKITYPDGTVTTSSIQAGNTITISKQGQTKIEAWVKDSAGNQSATNEKIIKIDSDSPTIITNLWASNIKTNGFRLNIKVQDAGSGLNNIKWYYKKSDETTYKNKTTTCGGTTAQVTKYIDINGLTSGVYNVYAVIYDKAGKSTKTGVLNVTTLNIDREPTLYATPSEWTNENVTVSTTQTTQQYMSNNSLSIQYQIGSTTGTWTKYTNAITISDNSTIYYRYTDNVNTGDIQTLTIANIDKIAPGATTITYNSGSNSTSWQNNISITLSATDTGGSGISYFEIDSTGDGNANSSTLANFIPDNSFNSSNVRFRAVDNAGNRGPWSNKVQIYMDTESTSKVEVKLQVTNVTTGVIEGDYVSGTKTNKNVLQTFTATDNVGIEYYEYSHDGTNVAGTISVNTWTIDTDGQWDFYVRAVDYAGNCGPWSDKYTVWRDTVPDFTSQEFSYTGNIEEFIVPITGVYTLEVWGAQGQSAGSAIGGKGGYSIGNIHLTQGTKLYIGVGGQPIVSSIGGYNGGGTGDNNYGGSSGAGGGATHIAQNNNRGTLDGYNSNRNEVLIVAGRRRWSFIFMARWK